MRIWLFLVFMRLAILLVVIVTTVMAIRLFFHQLWVAFLIGLVAGIAGRRFADWITNPVGRYLYRRDLRKRMRRREVDDNSGSV